MVGPALRRWFEAKAIRPALALAFACLAHPAFADGAFPDELTVSLPANAPNRIILGTNFGLVVSEDGGQTWRFVCELFITGTTAELINFYKLASDGALFAVSAAHLWRSSDVGCSWARAGGTADSVNVSDAFVDPRDSTFVVALASSRSGSQSGIYPSHDGGRTFEPPLYTTPDVLTGVEIASSSGTLYATQVQRTGTAGNAYLLKSTDRGAHWIQQQLAVPPDTLPRIAAVDPVDADKVYLRLLRPPNDSIAIATDDGRTLSSAVTLSSGIDYFSSFLRTDDGTLYAGTIGGDLYVQAPGETGFTRRVGPKTRCLGQRPGTSRIYACGDWLLDGYNLGYSDDGARTFQPMMSFTQIAGPLTCPAVNEFCYSQFIILQQTLGVGLDAGTPDGGQGPAKPGSHCSGVGGAGLALVLAQFFRRRTRPRSFSGK